MATMISSVVIPDGHTQIDGRRYVTEVHTDSEGVVHRREYLAPTGADTAAIATAAAAQIIAALEQAEIDEVLNA